MVKLLKSKITANQKASSLVDSATDMFKVAAEKVSLANDILSSYVSDKACEIDILEQQKKDAEKEIHMTTSQIEKNNKLKEKLNQFI